MTQDIESLENHVIICGFGRIGQMVARRLKDEHQLFIVIDNDSERIALAREQGMLMYQGNANRRECVAGGTDSEGPVSGDSPAR